MMKKKRSYRTGAVFHFNDNDYILTQTGYSEFNLISLEDDSNRWTEGICNHWHTCFSVSDRKIRQLIGKDLHTKRTRRYQYLGQFPEVFEKRIEQ